MKLIRTEKIYSFLVFAALTALWLLAIAPAKAQSQLATNRETLLQNVRQLIFEGKRSGEGYFSPDGGQLVFQSEREPGNPFYQIYLLDFGSGNIHRVSPGIGKTTCAFFRPGKNEVLFASTHHYPEVFQKQKAELDFRASGKQRRYAWDYDEQMDIFSARRDGTRLKRLTTSPGYDAEGAYSPDGKKIVFCSLRSAYPTNQLSSAEAERFAKDPAWFGDLYLMNADGSEQQRLTQSPGYDGGPFFSPDGKKIIWRRFNEEGTAAEVFTMNVDGSEVRQLTRFNAMSWAPYFHPSGDYLIFTANKEGFTNFELYLVDADGKREPLRVTWTDGFDGLPVFSPDGKRLVWSSARGQAVGSQLFIADWNHQAAMQNLKPSTDWSNLDPDKKEKTEPEIQRTVVENRELRSSIEYLSSDRLEGRMTGSKGAQEAANYLANEFKKAGLLTWGPGNNYFHDFEFSAGVKIKTNENILKLRHPQEQGFELNKDFRPLPFSASGTVEGTIVFAGYGLHVPGNPDPEYDSYSHLNVSNKIVLVLRYLPEDLEPKRRQELNRYAGLRYKAMMARERGAKAILAVSGPNSPGSGDLVPFSADSTTADSGIMALSITTNLAELLLSSAGKNLKDLQTALDKESPHTPPGFEITNVSLQITASLEHPKKKDRNIIGFLPPRKNGKHEYLVVGAHYDHLGYGETGAFDRQGESGQIHPGADDNASGTAAVLQLASRLQKNRKAHDLLGGRGIIFALWSGEEIGVIGSSSFLEQNKTDITNMIAYLNFDMVGRMKENKLMVQGVGSSTDWRRMVEKINVVSGLGLVLQNDPYLPTDVTAFYPRGIPVLSFFTGSHEDYHRPTDTAEKINYLGLQAITDLAEGIILEIGRNPNRLTYSRVESSGQSMGGRETLRAYLGTIPDYAAEGVGVKLSGVRPGSPAEKAGLMGGDILIELGGQKLANIYDYTYALDAVKIGKPVEMVVLRNGEKIRLSVIPELRK